LRSLDSRIVLWVNSFLHCSPAINHVFALATSSYLHGFALTAILVWLWFREDESQENIRKRLMAAWCGTLLATVVARAISLMLPFRIRPLHNADLHFVVPDGVDPNTLVGWSSFPSDTAAVLYALAFGVLTVRRRLGVIMLLYVTCCAAFPRIYTGLHYPSDILGAAVIAACCIWACHGFRESVGNLGLKCLRLYPGPFYGFGFFLAAEIATLFEALRAPVRLLLRLRPHN
jgi:undecaprenyl-diphosphatase